MASLKKYMEKTNFSAYFRNFNFLLEENSAGEYESSVVSLIVVSVPLLFYNLFLALLYILHFFPSEINSENFAILKIL